jgi:hypothetical protein
MGLDGVELVLAVEREFNLRIPDEAVVQMEKAGDIQNWLFRYFQSGPQASTFTDGARSDEEIWIRLRRLVAEHFGVPVEVVERETLLARDDCGRRGGELQSIDPVESE